MTKKDYIALAMALRKIGGQPSTDMETLIDCCRAIAGVCETDNPRFSRIRFLQACAPDPN